MLFKDFDGKEDGGYIIAYASTFDREPDLHGDIIAKGAFAESLADWRNSGKPIPLIFNHSFDDPSNNIGRVVEAVEDDHGLLIKAEFDPDSEKAQYVRKLVQEGRMYKMSFGSIVQEAHQVELEGGIRCREISKSKILEVSIVQIPANEHAEIITVKNGEDAEVPSEVIFSKDVSLSVSTDEDPEPKHVQTWHCEALMKALDGFSQSLTLRLTDAQGNVVSEIPLTAEFVASELAPTSSDQPADEPEVNSEEETPETQEGDSSADTAGETGAPAVDKELLAQIYQTLNQGETNVSESEA